jgi:hypothetical protein
MSGWKDVIASMLSGKNESKYNAKATTNTTQKSTIHTL